MAYGCINTDGLPRLDNWIAALSRWECTKPWRGSDTNVKPLESSRRKKHMTIRKTDGSDIACRLYHTDVAVYHEDGDISLTPYPSTSTDAFANRLLPSGLVTWFNQGNLVNCHTPGRHSWEVGTRLYKLSQRTRFTKRDDGWYPTEKTEPFKHYLLDMKRANAALKARGYNDFRDWFKAYKAMGGEIGGTWGRPASDRVVQWLEERETGWPTLAKLQQDVLSFVRDAIYCADRCITVVEKETISPTEWPAYKASEAKWRYKT